MLLTDSNAVLCLRSALLLRLNVHLLALVQPSSAARNMFVNLTRKNPKRCSQQQLHTLLYDNSLLLY